MFLSWKHCVEILVWIFMERGNWVIISHPYIWCIWLFWIKVVCTHKFFEVLINVINELRKFLSQTTVLMLYVRNPLILNHLIAIIFIIHFRISIISPLQYISNSSLNFCRLYKILPFNRISKTIRCNRNRYFFIFVILYFLYIIEDFFQLVSSCPHLYYIILDCSLDDAWAISWYVLLIKP